MDDDHINFITLLPTSSHHKLADSSCLSAVSNLKYLFASHTLLHLYISRIEEGKASSHFNMSSSQSQSPSCDSQTDGLSVAEISRLKRRVATLQREIDETAGMREKKAP